MTLPYIYLDDHIQKVSRLYESPMRIITAQGREDLELAFADIKRALADGYYVCGYGSYELGYALDNSLHKYLPDSNAPLLKFGVFKDYAVTPLSKTKGQTTLPLLRPDWTQAEYEARFKRLIAYIEAGDIYQANLTFPYRGHSQDRPDLSALYGQLRGRQPVRYGAIVSLDETQILSLSPELFFSVKDGLASARPMKGTAARGATSDEDARIASAMQADEKSQAENLMIVDLLRNDLSRVSDSGSVTVTDLFSLETFPTLHQMTSGIQSRLRSDIDSVDTFKALFPCGSVTGAPKIRAMEIIDELETRPRGPYCGAIGYFDPNGDASFNVAIRTLVSEPNVNEGYDLTYNVGSGVVYDSGGSSEYEECRLKARIVTDAGPDIIETLAWHTDSGFAYLDRHMVRLMRSADALSYALDVQVVMKTLDAAIAGKDMSQRVRVSLSARGVINVETHPLLSLVAPLKARLSKHAVNSGNPDFGHKLSPMPLYTQERERLKSLPDCDELIFVNAYGELTEGSFTTIFVRLGDQLFTPPLSAGILPGVLREHLIDTGQVKIRTLKPCDLAGAQAVYLGNSVRGLMRAAFDDLTPL